MNERAQHNEGREPSMRDVREILRALREGSRENPEVLAIDSYNIMLSLNKGFPKHMYHAELDPVQAKDKQDEAGLKELGYVDHYIVRQFPMWIYRRNFHPRYRLELGPNDIPKPDSLEFIESRLVVNQAAYTAALKEPLPWRPEGVPAPGPWVTTITDIPPIERGSDEEVALELARVRGQLEESRMHAADQANGHTGVVAKPAPRRGRPPRRAVEQEVEA